MWFQSNSPLTLKGYVWLFDRSLARISQWETLWKIKEVFYKACSQWWPSSTLTIIRLQLGYIERANRVQIPSKSALEGSKDIFLFRVLLKQITGETICVNFADASH